MLDRPTRINSPNGPHGKLLVKKDLARLLIKRGITTADNEDTEVILSHDLPGTRIRNRYNALEQASRGANKSCIIEFELSILNFVIENHINLA